jgi:hypothetical protein
LEGVARRPCRSTQTMWAHGSLNWLDGDIFRRLGFSDPYLAFTDGFCEIISGCWLWTLDTNLCCSLIDAQVPNLTTAWPCSVVRWNMDSHSRFATASRCGLTLRLQEYFSKTVGPVKKVLLNYNKNGRSVGVATIIFSQAQSAAEAAKKLDSVKVDGKPMRVSLC